MNFSERFSRWEGIIFGFMLGIAATVVGSMTYNQINGLMHVSHWKRSLHNRQLEEIAALMEEELAVAMLAMEDGVPLEISHYLATRYMPMLYSHHMEYAMTLLRNEDVTKYNALRKKSPFLTFNLSQKNLSGLDLRSADFSGAELTGTNFSGCNLADARFLLAEMPRADLTDADVTRASFSQAILSSAILTRIHGEAPDFSEAIMVDVSLTRLDGLRLANFADAELDPFFEAVAAELGM